MARGTTKTAAAAAQRNSRMNRTGPSRKNVRSQRRSAGNPMRRVSRGIRRNLKGPFLGR